MLFIKALARQHPTAWSLVYQADVRMRSEHFPRILARLEDEHDEAKEMGWRTRLDPAMKWDAVFREAAEGEKDWWERHIKNPGMMVNCGVLQVRQCIDGDAHITTQQGSTSTGTDTYTMMPSTVTGAGGRKGRRDTRPGHQRSVLPSASWWRRLAAETQFQEKPAGRHCVG